MDKLIVIEHMDKVFGNYKAIDDLSFSLEGGKNLRYDWAEWSRKVNNYVIADGLDFSDQREWFDQRVSVRF